MKLSSRNLAKALLALWILQSGNIAFAAILLPELPPELIPGLIPQLPLIPDPSAPLDPLTPEEEPVDVGDLVSGNVITDAETVETQVQPITSALNGQIRNILQNFIMPRKSRGGGASADSGLQGVWTNYGSTDFENTFTRTHYDGTTELAMLGYDYILAENHLFGVMLGTEATDIDTRFNNGRQETQGQTVAPYYGWLISDTLSFDLSFGSSDLDTDQFRISPLTLGPVPAVERVTSKVAGARSFTTTNLNGFWTVGGFNLGARLGYLSVKSDQDAYTESDGTAIEGEKLKFTQSYIGADMSFGERSQPFLGVTRMKDSSSEYIVFPSGEQPSMDDESMLLVAGWRYYGDSVNAILEWNKRQDQTEYAEDTLLFTLRFNSN